MVPNPVSYCRAAPVNQPFKASAAAPRPRKKVCSGLHLKSPPSPLWDPRLHEIGTGARTSQYASNTVRISDGCSTVVLRLFL